MKPSRWKTMLTTSAGLLAATVVGALVARSRLPVRDDPDGADIALVSIFDGTAIRPTSSAFKGGTVVSIFGGTQLDLRRANLAAEHGLLRVTTVFGGTNITVPDGWRVLVNGPTLAGGVEKSLTEESSLNANAPVLHIDARTVFGGLRVTARPVLRAAGETA